MKSVMWMIVPIAIGMALVVGCSTDNILSYEDQLKKDITIIDKYLAKNGIEATIDTLTGLRLVVTDAGAGLFPGIESRLTVKYKGSFLNGGVFADPPEAQTFTIPLGELIQGWQVAFGKYVAKGGKATLYVPSGLGYGRAGTQGIPGNSNLIFEVELIGYTN
jgi:FKBP-type peptidyl-prolyl cis-trans isomerase FkpA